MNNYKKLTKILKILIMNNLLNNYIKITLL